MPDPLRRVVRPVLLSLTLALAAPAAAQSSLEQWGFDPSVLVADAGELLLRAPDASVDGLLQALQASAQSPQDARTLCALFDPQADRSLDGLNTIASQLGEDSRVRFANAVADFAVAAAQNPRQPYDAAFAAQALKAAGVRAALRDDGFVAGLNGGDHAARCRAVGTLLTTLQAQPLPERAAVTRLLLREGLNRLAAGAAP